MFSGSVVPGARFDPYRPPVPDDDQPRPERQNPGYIELPQLFLVIIPLHPTVEVHKAML